MRFLDVGRTRKSWLTAVVVLAACTPAAPTGTIRPPTTGPTTGPTSTAAAATAAPTRNPSPLTSPSAQAAETQTPTQAATSSPPGGDGLAALFATLAPALAPFGGGTPSLSTGEQVIERLEETREMVPESVRAQINAEIARYQANGLAERAFMQLGSTPAVELTVDRFISDAGAAADFPIREPSGACDELTLPGAPLGDVHATRCDAPGGSDLYLIAHRAEFIVTARVLELPEDVPIEPVAATLAEIFRAIEPSLTR